MREKILSALKTKYTGVQNALLDRVAEQLSKTVTDESKIQDAVNGLDNLPISVTAFAEMLQTEGDRRANEAAQTRESKLKSEFDFTPKGGNPKPPTVTPPANETLEQKELRELKEWRASVEAKEQKTQLLIKLHTKLDEKKIPRTFADGIAIEKEEDIENAFKTVEEKFTSVKQHFINENILTEKPAGGVNPSNTDAVKADIENLASKF